MKPDKNNRALSMALVATAGFASAEVIGTYDFEAGAGGEEFIAKNVTSGMTLSALNVNNLSITAGANVKAQGDSLTSMSTGNYLSVPGDSGTVSTTGAATAGELYFSFTVTNNTGVDYDLTSLSVTVGGDNITSYFVARVFTNIQGFDSAVDDTIGRIGNNVSNFSAFVDTVDFTAPEGSNIVAPADFVLSQGETMTFYLPFTHPSTSTTNIGEIDDITLEGSAASAPPTPPGQPDANTLAMYDFESGAGGEEFTAKHVASGITLSQLSVGNLTGAVVEPQANSLTGLANGQYLSLPGDSGTVGFLKSAMDGNLRLSFTLTNNTGSDLTLTSLSMEIGGNNVYERFLAQIYSDLHGADNLIGHNIATLGERGGGGFNFSATDYAAQFHYPAGGLINTPNGFIIPDGSSIEFYIPIIHNSSSNTRIGEIDSIHLRTGPAGDPPPATQSMPNILCLCTEDMSPWLGCYGDTYVSTPNIDGLADIGLLYNYAWSNGPACSPARTTLISGMYATSTGGTIHRNNGGATAPSFMRYYSTLMKEQGYYVTNNGKTDYNLNASHGWDGSNWTNRPTSTTPFLAVYNYFPTHESSMNNNLGSLNNDYTTVPVSPIYPDIPGRPETENIRRQLTKHYDTIEDLDSWVKNRLDQLWNEGVEQDTIVFFYSDHGTGAPGGKRYVGSKGNRIPLIAYFPPNWAHLAPPGYSPGSDTNELVSFVDFAPTLLSIAGQPKESWHHGRAFAGSHYEAPPANDYLFGYTDKMGERTWLTRSVFDGRYVYIRNYRPDQPHHARTNYQFNQTFSGDWENMFFEGVLTDEQEKWFLPQGAEELYDLDNDPHELNNLANDPSLQAKLLELRNAQLQWRSDYGDLAFLIEGLRYEYVQAAGGSHWELLSNPTYYNADLLAAADRASFGTPADVPAMLNDLTSSNASIRHWGLAALMIQGRDTVRANEVAIKAIMDDTNESYYVRAMAAQALGTHGTEDGITNNQTAALDYLFAQCQDNVHGTPSANSSSERIYSKHMQAIDELPYIPESYRTQIDGFEGSTSWTGGFRTHIRRNFYTQYNNPLAEFRHEHGLERLGSEDDDSEPGDGVPNILKFAFNIAPNEGDLDGPAPGAMVPGGASGLPVLFEDGGSLKYQFVRRKPQGDGGTGYLPTANADYSALTNTDLGSEWIELGGTPVVESIDGDWERVTYTLPTDASSRFMRVEVRR